MENEIAKILLNGMEVPFFIAMFILALAGILVLFLTDVNIAVKKDKSTPGKFNFWYMLKTGSVRIIVGVIVISIAIIYFGEISQIVFQIQDPLPLNGAVAFMIGLGSDTIIKKIVHYGKDGTIVIKKKLKK